MSNAPAKKESAAKVAANPNLNLYNALRAAPKEAIKEIKGGRLKGFSDINPMWRIKALTEQFGPCGFGWYADIVERWQEEYKDEIAVFVKIHLFVKYGAEWSKPIVGVGGSKVAAREQSGIYFTDEGWKMAYTDAISVACKSLGMAADIYFDKDVKVQDNRTKYDQQSEATPAAQEAPAEVCRELPPAIRIQCIRGYVEGKRSKQGKPLDQWYREHTNAGKAQMDAFYADAEDYRSTLQ